MRQSGNCYTPGVAENVLGSVEPATGTAGDDSPLGDTEIYYATSRHVDEVFKIFVGHCGTRGASEPYGLLCLTDGNGFFGAAVDIVRILQLSAHLPPLLVVGIGYRVATLADTMVQRARDLTPTRSERFTKVFPAMATTGGADRFLSFVRDELLPWTQAHYSVNPELTAYFGHSFGGLFGTYAMFIAPDTFSRYAIGSPSYWWDWGAVFRIEQEYAETHSDLPVRVFMAIGAHETHDGRQREAANLSEAEQAITASQYIDMVDDMARMTATLRSRNYPGLRLDTEVFPDEFHITVPTLTMSRALRVLFDSPR
jgi:predicted alpha/beta superfamily hydrolase